MLKKSADDGKTTDGAVPETVATPPPIAAPAASADPVGEKLATLGVDIGAIGKIKALGAETEDDLSNLIEKDLIDAGIPVLKARKVLNVFKPVSAASPAAASTVDPNAEVAEGQAPSQAQVTSFAGMTGMDPMSLMMIMNGQGSEMDLGGLIPIPTIVAGYNPKLRNLYLMIMGQVERSLGVPIVIIDGDGSINRPLTIEYIEGLQEGRDPAENNIYFDTTGTPHEVIRVGVDAQSIYDADPLMPNKALQKSGMGTGRVNWTNVSLEVRQVAFYAATKTNELEPNNDGHMSWLRDHMKVGVNRLVFHGQAPRAISEYNEAARTGSLPTLRVMLARSARRPEIFPRRRRTSAGNLSGIGSGAGNDETI